MKKLFTTLLLALFAFVANAQDNPNRVIVQPKYKAPVGYLAERIDSIYFTKIEGRVAADVKVLGYAKSKLNDTIHVAITKTPDCVAYKIACLPTAQAKAFASDAAVEQYFDQLEDCPTFTDDYTNAALYGLDMEFKAKSSYSVVTLGYDKYGIACASSRSDFTTPASDLVGNPTVGYKILEANMEDFSIYFTPNDDCYGYYLCAFEAGTAEDQFEHWSTEAGFVNLEDMIKSWGGEMFTGAQIHKWSQMKPGTDYEVYVLPVDINEEDAPMIIIPVSTTVYGGEGQATVTITIGEFGQWSGSYYQYVTFTPNDQATLMRDLVLDKESLLNSGYWGDGSDAYITSYLTGDDFPDYWNRYGEDVSQWGVNPNTDYVAFAIAQNGKGEWGPLAKKEFSTTTAPPEAPVKPVNGCPRLQQPTTPAQLFQPGKAPQMTPMLHKRSGVTLQAN